MSERNNSKITKPLLVDTDIGAVRKTISVKNNVVSPSTNVYMNNPAPSSNALRIAQAFFGAGAGLQRMADTEVEEARMDYAERKQAEAEAKQAAREAEAAAKEQRREDAEFWANTEGVKLLLPITKELNNRVQSPDFSADKIEETHNWYSERIISSVNGADRETKLAMGAHIKSALLAGFDQIQGAANKIRVDNTTQDFNSLYESSNLDVEQLKTHTNTLLQNNIADGGSRKEALDIAKSVLLQQMDTSAEKRDSERITYLKQTAIDSGVVIPGTNEFYKWSEHVDEYIRSAEAYVKENEQKYAANVRLKADSSNAQIDNLSEAEARLKELIKNTPKNMTSEDSIRINQEKESITQRMKELSYQKGEHLKLLQIFRERLPERLNNGLAIAVSGGIDAASAGVIKNEKGEYSLVPDGLLGRIWNKTERRYLASIGDLPAFSEESEDLLWRILNDEFKAEGVTEIKTLNPKYQVKREPDEWTVDHVSSRHNKEAILGALKRKIKDTPHLSAYQNIVNTVPESNPEHASVRLYLANEIAIEQRKTQISEWQRETTKRKNEFEGNVELWRENYLTSNQSLDETLFGTYSTSVTMSNDLVEIQEYNEDYRIINIANKLYEDETGRSLSDESPERVADVVNYYFDTGQIEDSQESNYKQLYRELSDELEPYALESIRMQQGDVAIKKRLGEYMPALQVPEKNSKWGIDVLGLGLK